MNDSVQFSHCVSSNSVTHGLQHARLPCPSLSPRICSNSCPLSRWWHRTILSSVLPLSCLQYFPASRSFPMHQLLTSGDQIIGASASASVLPMNIRGWFPLGWTGWISLLSKEHIGPLQTWWGSSSSVLPFCLFILFMGFSRQESWSGLPFPPPVDHILSELFTMTCPSWVALHGMAHIFIEFCHNKAVIHEGVKFYKQGITIVSSPACAII